MRLTLLGHAAFYIETGGRRIVMDPYHPSIGFFPVDMETDFVTVSHYNPLWHSCVDNLYGEYRLIEGLKIVDRVAAFGEIRFGSVRVFENLPDDGENAMVWFESEGLRVLHMGDSGHLPTAGQVQACGKVEVLLALAGGPPTIELQDLLSFVAKLRPKVVIPMHFGVPGLKMESLPPEILAGLWPGPVVFHQGSTIDTAQLNVGNEPELHVVKPLRQLCE